MEAALVKIDVAAADLDKSVAEMFDLAVGGTLIEKGLTWVFNLANDPNGDRRDLRFWRPEVLAHSQNGSKYSAWEIERVLAKILPVSRVNFHAGEVDKLFQIRPRTRIDLHDEIAGSLKSGRHQYHRDDLAAFLIRRWVGARLATKLMARGGTPLSPDKAAPLHTMPKSSSPRATDSAMPISRVGNSRATGSPAKSSLP
jgi:hypothetical protein